MNYSDIELMAQGFPPSSIGKDHEEVVIFLATSLLAAQQKLDAVKALAGVAGEMNGVVKDGFAEVVEQRDALAAENALIHSTPSLAAMMSALDAFYEHEDLPETGMLKAHTILLPKRLPATHAALNAIRAEGVIMFAIKQLAAAGDLESTITLERLMLDAEELAGQLRGSQDGE